MPWALPRSDRARLALAKAYPFETPGTSYLFRGGAAVSLGLGIGDPGLYDGRTPVIAHGSNRSPTQLRRKFGDDAEIPVSRAWLDDHDVVYSAHITRYGAIAANLQHSPGTRVEVFVTWLDPAQLGRMHETELPDDRYLFGRLANLALTLESGPSREIAEACVYLSTQGCLADRGAPIALAAVKAEGRQHRELHQEAALALVRDRHRPGRDLDQVILEIVRHPARRHALIEEMRRDARPPTAPLFQPLEV